MNATTLRGLIVAELNARGFQTGNEHAKTVDFAEAIAVAIVTHIQTDARAVVSSGSSAGSWPIA